MTSKQQLVLLIDLIKQQTGKTQFQISKEAGYNERYLSQQISKDDVSPKIIANLKKTFKVSVENENIAEDTGLPYNKKAPAGGEGDTLDKLVESNRRLIDAQASAINNETLRLQNEANTIANQSRLISLLESKHTTGNDGLISHELNASLTALEVWIARNLAPLQQRSEEELLNELDTEKNLQLGTS